jgi:hypothetical protein
MNTNPSTGFVPDYWSSLLKTFRIWLLILAAMALATPLGAEEINAPDAHWQTASTTQPAADGAQSDEGTAQNVAQGAAQIVAQSVVQPIVPVPSSIEASKPDAPEKTQRQIAEEQLKEQETQRVAGVLPAFNVSYRSDAVSLTAGQKMGLAFRTATDSMTIAFAVVTAGYHELDNDISNAPWGAKGFAERSGIAYLDTFDGNMIGNGILPALLHQDPRYFRLGHGSVIHRALYAAAAQIICKHDNTQKWEPNYSNVLGNVAAGGLSTLYYPSGNSGVGLVFSTAMIQTAQGSISSIAQEFWPDISRKFFHKDPTHGLDAQYSAAGK